jgi:hypothetical protein
MGRVFRSLLFSALLAAGAGQPAWGYIQTVTPSGTPVRWPGGFKLNLAGNATNASGLSDQDVHNAVTRSLQRWQAASSGTVSFDYWQGRDPNIYEADSDYNGLSSIYFASNSRGGDGVTPNILGLTQVWYNSETGEILESDTVLNDRDFIFTTNPTDTSGYGGETSGGRSGSRVYIENVITHELGHAFGLSHSAGLQSTMLFMESPEQAHLGCDEQVGIHALYPSGDNVSRGVIAGRVVTSAGAGIFGAHVVAVSRERGTVLATGLSDRSGAFSISGLEPGPYYLIAEPYYAGSSALPSYYSGINEAVCGGQVFRRTILTDSTGYVAHAVNVPAGGVAQAPAISVHCSPTGDAVSSGRSSATLASAPPVYDGSDPTGFGVVDRFNSTSQTYYRLSGVSGHLDVHGLAYSIYSPIHATLSLQDSFGNSFPAETMDHVYTGDSGYVNYDTELVADNLPQGDYLVRVSVTTIGVSYYPAGPVMLDTDPFLLITGNVNAPAPALASALPANARCRMDENFAAYQSPPGDPPRNSTDDGSKVGFCGTISSSGGGGDGPGPGEIVGWLLPWLLMAGMGRAMVRIARSQRPSYPH